MHFNFKLNKLLKYIYIYNIYSYTYNKKKKPELILSNKIYSYI